MKDNIDTSISEQLETDKTLPPIEGKEDDDWGPFYTGSSKQLMKDVRQCFPLDKFRSYQEAIINKIIESFKTYKYVVVEAPTGSGKSIIAYTVANLLSKCGPAKENNNSYFTVPYKVLQDQYIKDFKDIALMKGVSNYKCYQDPTQHCGAAPCRIPSFDTELNKAHENTCPYQVAKKRAIMNKVTLFNAAAFLTFENYTEAFKPRKLIVVDEAHTIENALMQFIGISFHSESLKELGLMEDIPKFDNPEEYVPWIKKLYTYSSEIVKSIEDEVEDESKIIGCSPYSIMTKEEKKLLSLSKEYAERASRFLSIADCSDGKSDEELENTTEKIRVNDSFVVSLYEYASKQTLEFKPIVVDKFAYDYFFRHGGYFLFLSATIYIDDFCRSMGLDRKEVKFFKIPSTFPNPKKRRPFIVDGKIGALNNRVLDNKLPAIVNRIEEISSNYPDLKGVIHTHTYKINDYLLKHASDKLHDRLISHKGGNIAAGLSREEALKEHIKTNNPSILLSPMMYEGVDLKGDLARWQIIVKCFTDEVDALTPDGLKKVKDLEKGDKVYSYNMETGEIEIDRVINVLKKEYNGNINRFVNNIFDLPVTPEHDMVVSYKKREGFSKFEKRESETLVQGFCAGYMRVPTAGVFNKNSGKSIVNLFDYIESNEILKIAAIDLAYILGLHSTKQLPNVLKNNCKYFIEYPYYNGNCKEYIFKKDNIKFIDNKLLSVLKYKGRPHCKSIPILYEASDFLELCGWFISEGFSFCKNNSSYGIKICQNSIVNKLKFKRIENLIKRMSLNFHYGEDNKVKNGVVITSDLLYRFMKEKFGNGSLNKKIDKWVYQFNTKSLSVMFNAMMNGDGSFRKNEKLEKYYRQYSTSSPQLVEDVKILVRLLGFTVSNIESIAPNSNKSGFKSNNIHYRLGFTCRDFSCITKKVVKKEYYSGMVYCPTIEKNGTLLAGVNGKLMVTGNCPYSSLIDPQIKSRMEIDPEWYQWQTILKLVQAYGRSTRSKEDWSYTFMLDRNFLGLYYRNKHMFSKWFLESLVVKKES